MICKSRNLADRAGILHQQPLPNAVHMVIMSTLLQSPNFLLISILFLTIKNRKQNAQVSRAYPISHFENWERKFKKTRKKQKTATYQPQLIQICDWQQTWMPVTVILAIRVGFRQTIPDPNPTGYHTPTIPAPNG